MSGNATQYKSAPQFEEVVSVGSNLAQKGAPSMDSVKDIGMDVHKEAISVAVLNFSSKLVMECTIETKATTILDFRKGLRGSWHVTLEEATWAAWLYDLIHPHGTELVVCNPRRNALL